MTYTMSDNNHASRSGIAVEHTSTENKRTIDTDELLAVLAEEYTKEILAALGKEPMSAREIVDSSGASRPTVYRRLNQLEAAGAVETTISTPSDGQQHKEFRLVIEEVEFSPVIDTGSVEDVKLVASNCGP